MERYPASSGLSFYNHIRGTFASKFDFLVEIAQDTTRETCVGSPSFYIDHYSLWGIGFKNPVSYSVFS